MSLLGFGKGKNNPTQKFKFDNGSLYSPEQYGWVAVGAVLRNVESDVNDLINDKYLNPSLGLIKAIAKSPSLAEHHILARGIGAYLWCAMYRLGVNRAITDRICKGVLDGLSSIRDNNTNEPILDEQLRGSILELSLHYSKAISQDLNEVKDMQEGIYRVNPLPSTALLLHLLYRDYSGTQLDKENWAKESNSVFGQYLRRLLEADASSLVEALVLKLQVTFCE